MKSILFTVLFTVSQLSIACGGDSKIDTEEYDLTGLSFGKGRIQDEYYSGKIPLVDRIVRNQNEALPKIIEKLKSKRESNNSFTCPGYTVEERVIALALLGDLFLDEKWVKSTFKSMCWENNIPYKEDLDTYAAINTMIEKDWTRIYSN